MNLVPPADARDEGADACLLAAGYGLVPDEWQELVIGAWLGTRADGKWSSPRIGLAVPRQNGKNALLEIRELYGLIVHGERILHTAHEVKTARKAFLRLLSFFDNPRQFPELSDLTREVRRTNGQEAIVLSNGGSVEFVARSKSSGRGFSVDVLVLDEAQELNEDAFAALRPTISASGNPQQIMTGTPPGPAAAGDIFLRTRTAGLKGEDLRLCWMEWSCLPDDDLDDLANAAQANPAFGIRLEVETILDERASMKDEMYGRERFGIWYEPENASGLDFSNWPLIADTASQPVSGLAYGLAVSPDREWASVSVAGARADGVGHVDVGKHAGGTAWVVPWLAALDRKRGITLLVDGGGPAASLIPDLQAEGVDVKVVGARELAQSFGLFMDAVRDSSVRHRDQPELNAAVKSAKKRAVGDGATAFGRKASGEDITPLEAAGLALLGHQDAQDHGFNIW